MGYFSFVTVTSSWNARLESGSSTLSITIGLPITAMSQAVLPFIVSCRKIGLESRDWLWSGTARLLISASTQNPADPR